MQIMAVSVADLFGKVPWIKVGLSIGTVFFGLICIVLLCKIIGLLCRGTTKEKNKTTKENQTVKPVNSAERQQILAAVVATIAEETGKDAKAFRVVSFKKI